MFLYVYMSKYIYMYMCISYYKLQHMAKRKGFKYIHDYFIIYNILLAKNISTHAHMCKKFIQLDSETAF